MKTRFCLLFVGLGIFSTALNSATIDFEGTGAPTDFNVTTALTDAFAADGVMFAGPSGNDGGAILNDAANLGIVARSGTDFLAFNSGTTLSDGGIPQGPETIIFDSMVSSVSIWANAGFFDGMFQLEAFDAAATSLGMVQVATSLDWELLSFAGPNIKSVQLSETSGIQAAIYDDLNFEPSTRLPDGMTPNGTPPDGMTHVPEPGTLVLLAAGLVGLLGLRRRSLRQNLARTAKSFSRASAERLAE